MFRVKIWNIHWHVITLEVFFFLKIKFYGFVFKKLKVFFKQSHFKSLLFPEAFMPADRNYVAYLIRIPCNYWIIEYSYFLFVFWRQEGINKRYYFFFNFTPRYLQFSPNFLFVSAINQKDKPNFSQPKYWFSIIVINVCVYFKRQVQITS